MRRVLAMLCVLATLLGMVTIPAFAADETAEPTAPASVLDQDVVDLSVTEDTTVDLNGHNIAGVTVADGATLYIYDSQTDDYTVADGVYGTVTGIAGNVAAAEGYIAITEEGAVSSHKVDLSLTSMTLRPAAAGVYYNSAFAADEVVAKNVECYGVALSVVAEPTAENLDTLCGYSTLYGFEAGEKSGTLLTGILSEGNTDFANDRNAAMPVFGRAYLKTAEGYTFGESVSRDLKTQVEAIDTVLDSLNETQKAAILAMYNRFETVLSGWNVPNMKHAAGTVAGDTVITVPVEVTDGEVTETVTVERNGVEITIPFGALVEGDKLTLTVTKLPASESGIEAEEGQQLLPFDVHVEGLSADNEEPLTVALGKVMPENLNMGNYTVYHVEEDGTNAMELVAVDEEFTAHNQYKYTLEGELTLNMASFSEVTALTENENIWNGTRNYDWYDADATTLYIRNADQLAGFGAIVGNMASADGKTIAQDSFKDKTVTLLADINIGDLDSENGFVFYPVGYWNNQSSYEKCYGKEGVSSGFYAFQGTFDGNGNTISDFYQNTWEMVGDYNDGYSGTPNYYREGMGLFGKVYGGTVKNLTVRNFSCDSEHGTSGTIAAYADCGATFENISIFGCNPRVYNIGNGGIVGCSGWYAQETAANKVTFRNISVDQSNKISALWDATGTSAGGILGQYYPSSGQSSAGYPANPGIHFENCHTAAIIEVNNDCCSNYHYYWYRYAGMLMGSIRKNTKDDDGYTVADTTGITAEGCTYTYGNWNEYWYCELVKNTIASYTHDHQFGRLTSITDLSEITNDGGKTWLKEGNFALLDENRDCEDCYHIFKDSKGNLYRHFHDVADETNPEVYETINGVEMLKEDRQRYYIPFGQLLTGDGMGVKAHHEFPGVTEVKDGTVRAQQKFQVKEDADLVFDPGQTVKLSDIVELTEFGTAKLTQAFLYAAASPVTEEDTVNVTYQQDVAEWTNNTITFSEDSFGLVKLVLTDYFYCEPTVIYATVGENAVPAVKFEAVSGVKDITTYTAITIGELFTAAAQTQVSIVSGNVQVTVSPADPTDPANSVAGVYTPNTEDWTKGTLELTGVGTAKVTITDYDFCIPTSTTVNVVAGDVNDTAVKMTFESLEADGKVSAFCPACAAAGDTALKDWYPMPVVDDVTNTGDNRKLRINDTLHHHYYLDAAVDYTKNNGYYSIAQNNSTDKIGTQLCLNLNGQVIVSEGRAFFTEGRTTLLNIMGDGQVTGNAFVAGDKINWRGAIDGTSPINLYGGTYISGNDAPAVSMRGGSDWCTVKVYKDVTLQASAENGAQQALFLYSNSNAVMYGGTVAGGIRMVSSTATIPNLTVSGAPVIDKVTTNGYLITVGALTQGASITVDADGIFTEEMASAAAANTALKYFHTVPKDGYKVATHYKSLAVVQDIAPENVLDMADLMDFSNADAETGAVTALCPACGLEAQWLPLEPITEQKADLYTEGKHHHFYLSDAKDYTGNQSFYQFSGDAACIHLNGRTLSSTARAFMSEKANSVMNIMGSGTVSGCGTYNGTIVDGVSSGVHNFFGGAVDTTSTVNLYGGTFKGGDSDAIVSSRGGSTRSSINVYGAQIVRTANDPAGLNVYVADNGEFNLYSGTISGGTAVSHMEMDGLYGGNILAKAFHTNNAYPCEVNIYGGTVTGGTAETKGGNIAVMGNSYARPTVTLNILGGTVTNGSVYLSGSNAKLNLSGAPVISELDMTAGNVANVSGLTEGAAITVSAEPGVPFTAAIAQNAGTIAAYFAATDPEQVVVVTGDNTLIVSAGLCPHCNVATELITWTELTASMVGKTISLTGHYYMSGDIGNVAQTIVQSADTRDTDLVIDLRGNSYSSKDGTRCFYVERKDKTTTTATLSLIDTVGGGTITGHFGSGGGTLYAEANATINMYAGTVSCEGTPYVGGAIYVIGTFNLYDGTINGTDVTQSTSDKDKRGGAAYVTGGTLNVYGGTINEGVAAEGNCIYAMNTCKLNFYGGTVNGEIVCSTEKTTVKVSGAPVVTDLNLLSGQKLTVDGELTEGASITVTADGVFTGTLADPAAVKDFFHAPEYQKIVVEGSALAVAEMSICEAAASMDFTGADADGKVTAKCPVCGTEAEWNILPANPDTTSIKDLESGHYYLSETVDYTQNNGLYNFTNKQICINLNGQTMVSAARAFYNENINSVLNMMGEGTVSGAGYMGTGTNEGKSYGTFDLTSNANFYGGTYISTGAGPAIGYRKTSSGVALVSIYEGTKVINKNPEGCAMHFMGNGSLAINGGTVNGAVIDNNSANGITISGNPVIDKLDLSNGEKVTVGAMTDGASVTVLAPVNTAFTETIEANAEAYADYFHAYELKKGVEVQDSALVITDACPHCGVPLADIQWTPIEETGKRHIITESGHYRLSESITASESNAISMSEATATTGLDVVLDTYGFNITSAAGRSFYIGKYNHFTVFDSMGGSVCSSNSTNAALGGSGFTAYANAVVNVYDITLSGSADAHGQGNCISVYGVNTVVNVYSGTFNGTDCTTSGNHGGTVYNHGTLNIYGGTFSDADVTDAFGGCLYSDGNLYIENAALNGDVYIAAGTVEVAGTAVIAELQLAEAMKLTVGDLRNGASIAVATDAADGVFTAEGNGQYQQYFSAVDNENCWVDATANGALYVATRALEAGFGRVSVVPTYEVKLAGGASTRMATECKDDLAVTCVALKESGEIYLVCSVDFITANSNYVSPAKKAMSAATGVPVENIIMNATHTHSSVDIRTTGWDNREQYLEEFCGKAAEAAAAAVDDLAVATVSYGSTQATGLTFVRHYLLNDGTYAGANYGDWTSGIKEHAYEADTEMQLIRFSRATKDKDVVMMNFGCHATNEQSETVMSADFPYFFRKFVEEHDTVDESGNPIAGSKDVLCAYFIAAAGDQVTSSRIRDELVSNYQEHGEALGRYAVAVLNGGSMTAMETVGTMLVTETFTGNRNIPTEEEYNKAMAVYEIWKTLDPNGQGNASAGRGTAEGKTAALNAEFESVYQVSAIISNYQAGLKDTTNSMELRIMSLGNIGVVFAPYEMFAEQGVYIKNNSSFEMTFIVTCSEGHEGYLPSLKGWEMDSYESHVTHYEKGTAETLAEEYVELLKELKGQ